MATHRPPHRRSPDAGFTVVELLAGLVIIGIISAIAIPNIASMYKPLSAAVSLTTSQLTLIRSKAMASSRAYRIRPKYDTAASYVNGRPNEFVVEYNEDGGSCNQNTFSKWGSASQFDFKLADRIILGVGDSSDSVKVGGNTSANYLAWDDTTVTTPAAPNNQRKYGLCFDSRGIPRESKEVQFWLVDEYGSSKAKSAKISVTGTGGVSYNTYSNTNGTGTNLNRSF